jgi:hypothetical protein
MERLWMDGAGVGTVGRLTMSPNSIPEEWTEPDDIAVCLASLTAAVIWLDEELEP